MPRDKTTDHILLHYVQLLSNCYLFTLALIMDIQLDRRLFREQKAKPSCPNWAGIYAALSDVCLEHLLGIQPQSGGVARQNGSVPIAEEQEARGVHVLWDGSVNLSIAPDNGNAFILGFAGRGAILGLPATISGRPYGVRTRVVRVAKVSFISQEDLLRHLHATGTVAYAAAELLSAIYRFELAGTSALFQSQSAEQKTARFLLGLSPAPELRCNATAGELENFNCAPVTSITAKTTFRWY